jgi:hypothetical protein
VGVGWGWGGGKATVGSVAAANPAFPLPAANPLHLNKPVTPPPQQWAYIEY